MSLYIRLQLSFWNHRKTLRLRAILGESALWILPRLWSYAAENQLDGDFSDYTAGELAMLIGYAGDADAMLGALLKAGFMDEGLKIHDWEEHNSYHSGYKARALVAATARWDRVREKKRNRQESTVHEKKGKEPSIATRNAPSTPEALALASLFNRKPTTEWSAKEVVAFKTAKPTQDELSSISRYYERERAKGKDGHHRRDMSTFLNNYRGEVDRAVATELTKTEAPKGENVW